MQQAMEVLLGRILHIARLENRLDYQRLATGASKNLNKHTWKQPSTCPHPYFF
jgi:hypothetical protein